MLQCSTVSHDKHYCEAKAVEQSAVEPGCLQHDIDTPGKTALTDGTRAYLLKKEVKLD